MKPAIPSATLAPLFAGGISDDNGVLDEGDVLVRLRCTGKRDVPETHVMGAGDADSYESLDRYLETVFKRRVDFLFAPGEAEASYLVVAGRHGFDDILSLKNGSRYCDWLEENDLDGYHAAVAEDYVARFAREDEACGEHKKTPRGRRRCREGILRAREDLERNYRDYRKAVGAYQAERRRFGEVYEIDMLQAGDADRLLASWRAASLAYDNLSGAMGDARRASDRFIFGLRDYACGEID